MEVESSIRCLCDGGDCTPSLRGVEGLLPLPRLLPLRLGVDVGDDIFSTDQLLPQSPVFARNGSDDPGFARFSTQSATSRVDIGIICGMEVEGRAELAT